MLLLIYFIILVHENCWTSFFQKIYYMMEDFMVEDFPDDELEELSQSQSQSQQNDPDYDPESDLGSASPDMDSQVTE